MLDSFNFQYGCDEGELAREVIEPEWESLPRVAVSDEGIPPDVESYSENLKGKPLPKAIQDFFDKLDGAEFKINYSDAPNANEGTILIKKNGRRALVNTTTFSKKNGGIVSYCFGAFGGDDDCPEEYLNTIEREFCDRYACGLNDIRTYGETKKGKYRKYLVLTNPEVAMRVLVQDAESAEANILKGEASPIILPRIDSRLFTGILLSASQPGEYLPKHDADIRNMKIEIEKRVASGELGEEIALRKEKERLRNEGRPDLAEKVESVAAKPDLGYDIKSFDIDGSDRFIEVKNVSKGNRFFLSEGQRQNSQARTNYWFYLVSNTDGDRHLVEFLSAAELRSEHLQPIEYIVRFTASE